MTQEPRIEQRDEQPYVAIARRGTIDGFTAAVDSGFPELFGWLSEHRVTPAGPPFIRYVIFDPEVAFEIEIGVPIAGEVPADDRVRSAVLPAGRYVAYLHVGAYRATTEQWKGRDLAAAHVLVSDWAEQQGIEWDGWETQQGPALRARVERYLVGPVDSPDPSQWETELAYLMRDGAPHGPRATGAAPDST